MTFDANHSCGAKTRVDATKLGYVLEILDTSIVNVALDPIAKTFSSNTIALQWVVSSVQLGDERVHIGSTLLLVAAKIPRGIALQLRKIFTHLCVTN